MQILKVTCNKPSKIFRVEAKNQLNCHLEPGSNLAVALRSVQKVMFLGIDLAFTKNRHKVH